MNAIILLGPPGAGKGTLAEELVKKGYQHVSTGDMMRAAIRSGSEVGQLAKSYMDKGELVPDDVIINIIKDLIDSSPLDTKFMFDGFPRTMVQAEKLDELYAELNADITNVILVDCDEQVIVKRLTGRRICKSCGAVYHIQNKPPVKEGICDVDAGELYQRDDDSEATVLNRLSVYEEQTEPLVAYYEAKNLVYRVDASYSIANIRDAVLEKLG